MFNKKSLMCKQFTLRFSCGRGKKFYLSCFNNNDSFRDILDSESDRPANQEASIIIFSLKSTIFIPRESQKAWKGKCQQGRDQ